MEKRYGALRIVGTIYKVLGIIAAVLTVLAVVALCGAGAVGGAALDSVGRGLGQDFGGGAYGGMLGGVLLSVVAVLYGGIIAITLYAFGEMIYLLIALEENTRLTAQMLQHQGGAASAPPG